jgi:hypothetical protein
MAKRLGGRRYYNLPVTLWTFSLFLLAQFAFLLYRSPATVEETIPDKNASIVVRAMPLNPLIYFIHVGKTGGTTLVKSLQLNRTVGAVKCMVTKLNRGRRRQDAGLGYYGDKIPCYKHSQNESQLVRHIAGFFHMRGVGLSHEERTWLLNNTNVFLFAIRDPIDRIISSYNYHINTYHNATQFPQFQPFYTQCFDGGLNAMVDTLENGPPNLSKLLELFLKGNGKACAKMGVDALSGHGPQGGFHFRLNYQYYKGYTVDEWPGHAVAVIRTEEMWADIIHLDHILNGTGDFSKHLGFKDTHGSEDYLVPYRSDIDVSNAIFLCCLIFKEMEAYQQLVLSAINLDDTQKRETLNNLLSRCHIKALKNDPVNHPFSWRAFRRGRICTGSLHHVRNLIPENGI